MKILMLDVETSPNTVFTWGLWKQTITIDKIIDSSQLLCWSAKWYGESTMLHQSIVTGSHKKMLRGIWNLLDKADVVIHYNGGSFDIPVINKEFVLAEMNPPAPYAQVDLLLAVRKAFRFPSNKLDFVCGALGLGQKRQHEGFQLWVKCMAKDPRAWRTMRAYNQHDVVILEKLYNRLKPWIKSHPNVSTHDDVDGCPTCGSNRINRRGIHLTMTMRYPKYNCRDCGKWFRGAYSLRSERKERFRGV